MDKVSPRGPPRRDEDREALVRRRRLFRSLVAEGLAPGTAVPPLSSRQLLDRAESLAASRGLTLAGDPEKKLLAIMIHNQAWRETVAAVPFERRLLLLPQCLRTRADCPAVLDEWGLLCQDCGRCPLGSVQREAADLGYAVLIAEGAGAVTGLLKGGNLDAVIGAGCLSALEQSFRHIVEEAVPALAIPLLREGCDATDVERDWLNEAIRLRTDTTARARISVDALRQVVQGWFSPASLRSLLGHGDHHALSIAADWMSASGKRWRPLLAVAAYDALSPAAESVPGDLPRAVAVAVECFHKASLIHDDIEDGDALRDGAPSLHQRHGVPMALNAGDLLLGEGYRLLAGAPADPLVRLEMLAVAADGHRRLCLGQGEELRWRRQPEPPTVADCINLFLLKTAPAFEVALLLGALAAGADPALCAALTRFSRSLGVAYQIRDELLDGDRDAAGEQVGVRRPSLLLALQCEQADAAERARILGLARGGASVNVAAGPGPWRARQDIVAQAEALQAEYRARALQSIESLPSVWLKSVLVRLVNRMLPGTDPPP